MTQEDEMVRHNCADCGHTLRIPAKYRGMKCGCGHCGARFILPKDAGIDEDAFCFLPAALPSETRCDCGHVMKFDSDGSGTPLGGTPVCPKCGAPLREADE